MILFVGGTFNSANGKMSGLITKIYEEMKDSISQDIVFYNGGNLQQIPEILQKVKEAKYVLWMPNITEDVEKQRNIKEINPRCILIGSKRNNNEYSFGELLTRSLQQKHNLCLEFSKEELIKMTLFDPLGNVFYSGTNVKELVPILLNRMQYLASMKRIPSIKSNKVIEREKLDPLFLQLVKEYAETFHELIQAQTFRFLGNCSTRCMRGFPSQRIDDLIYVSKRNVDKRYIDEESFVPCQFNAYKDDCVNYFNENKPSVDSPIQLILYKHLPNINFMIHSHCYVKDAPFTKHIIPCGALQEVLEILNVLPKDNELKNLKYFAINLKGHGSTVMANTSEQLRNIPYYARPIPELI